MPNILTIEDDKLVAKKIAYAMQSRCFSVDIANPRRGGVAKVMVGDYDVVTLDLMLPDLDGRNIFSTMRGIGMETPVLVMSALSDIDDRIRGLSAGGDDYLAKPFSPERVSARLDVLLRRRLGAKQGSVLRLASLELGLVRREVSHGERELHLQSTDFRVLEFMMRNPGQSDLDNDLRSCMGLPLRPGTYLVDVCVGRLREKSICPARPRSYARYAAPATCSASIYVPACDTSAMAAF